MLVFGALRPRRDQIGQLETARRWPPRGHPAVVAADLLVLYLPPVEVLPDVVQVEVERWAR